ncbi:DUF4384 domain-containing protein [Deinococcus ruber]|uniref:S-layer protein n=1 Tax=Deinococcus ruber TaxID=1848197 RepID=A0A918CM18_9DEIO|nr:DUF4384 domain-containing protein [Deinococcus ruber]GGR30061.1 S-layer protein [Deinococcus ruber]
MKKTLMTALVPSLLALTLPLAMGTTFAAPKISAQSIIVNPVQTSLGVKVWTDRDSSGQNTPNYYVGDRIRIYTSVNQDAYVYLFNVDPTGKVDLILPNRYAGGANFVRAGVTKAFPSSQDRFTFDIAAPYGLNKVLALASTTKLNLNDIANFQTQNAQATGFADVKVNGQQQLAQALSIVVNPVQNPVPQNSWITDVAFYNVAGGTPVTQPQPVPVPVQPVASELPPYSVTQQTEWRTAFDSARSANEVYSYYAAELQRQGYTQTDSRQDRGRLSGQFQKSGSVAELRVNQAGQHFDIVILKRS